MLLSASCLLSMGLIKSTVFKMTDNDKWTKLRSRAVFILKSEGGGIWGLELRKQSTNNISVSTTMHVTVARRALGNLVPPKVATPSSVVRVSVPAKHCPHWSDLTCFSLVVHRPPCYLSSTSTRSSRRAPLQSTAAEARLRGFSARRMHLDFPS